MKIFTKGKEEMVKTVELYCGITGWKLKINNEILELDSLSYWLKETKNLKSLKSLVKNLMINISFNLEMTVAERKKVECYLLRELSAFLELEEIWYIDNNSYEKGFEDGANEGYSEISDKLVNSIRKAIEQEKGSEKELKLLLKIGAETLDCSEDEFNQML